MPLSPLISLPKAAERTGASAYQLAKLARRGKLRIAGQDHAGTVLVREAEAFRAAAYLAEAGWNEPPATPPEPDVLPCGCSLPAQPLPGRDRPLRMVHEPIFLCREAQGLDLARRLTAALAAAAPGDPFFVRLAAVAVDALDRHLGTKTQDATSAPPRAARSALVSVTQRGASVTQTGPGS
jgi:hypothetical protein